MPSAVRASCRASGSGRDVERRAESGRAGRGAPVPRGESPRRALAVVDRSPSSPRIADAATISTSPARRVASVTLARPLIKVAALSYGFRRALDDEQRFRMRYAMRQELKRQTQNASTPPRRRAPSKGWRS